MGDFKATPLSREKIRSLAGRIRKKLGLDPTKAVDVLRLLEIIFPIAYASLGFRYQIVSASEMKDLHGLTDPENNVIYINEDVYCNAARGKGRDRMTIAHELAHYLLHDGITLGLARKLDGETVPAYMDPEWQATAFAAELLMPAEIIKDMRVEEIASRYGVSLQAARYQHSLLNK